ncbi:MAG: diacylglycerol kinase [Proteobacteria bacterium]|nr:diacylglycerol kinase [Pseudomonadota bacterium]
MTEKTFSGMARLVRAFCYSMQGLAAAWRNEAAFRQEIVLAALILPPGLWFAANGLERALLAASVIFVLVVELINSAVEAAIDRISPERHELSKRAKDLGSAAVLLALINVWVVWGGIFWPRLF